MARTNTVQNESGIKRLDINVTSNELKLLNTNPKELIPAPGIGFFLSVSQIVLKYTYGTVAYTQPGNTNAVMGATTNNIAQFGNVLNAGSSFIRQSNTNGTALIFENTALELYNTTSNMSNGDGTLVVTVFYTINQF